MSRNQKALSIMVIWYIIWYIVIIIIIIYVSFLYWGERVENTSFFGRRAAENILNSSQKLVYQVRWFDSKSNVPAVASASLTTYVWFWKDAYWVGVLCSIVTSFDGYTCTNSFVNGSAYSSSGTGYYSPAYFRREE